MAGVVRIEKGDGCFYVIPPKNKTLLWIKWCKKHGGSISYLHQSSKWQVADSLAKEAIAFFESMFWAIEGGQWQAGGQSHKNGNTSKTLPSVKKDAWSVLYVTKDAPQEVVVAAYKALVFLNHPDRGGDEERIKEINAAKDFVFKNRGW